MKFALDPSHPSHGLRWWRPRATRQVEIHLAGPGPFGWEAFSHLAPKQGHRQAFPVAEFVAVRPALVLVDEEVSSAHL